MIFQELIFQELKPFQELNFSRIDTQSCFMPNPSTKTTVIKHTQALISSASAANGGSRATAPSGSGWSKPRTPCVGDWECVMANCDKVNNADFSVCGRCGAPKDCPEASPWQQYNKEAATPQSQLQHQQWDVSRIKVCRHFEKGSWTWIRIRQCCLGHRRRCRHYLPHPCHHKIAWPS